MISDPALETLSKLYPDGFTISFSVLPNTVKKTEEMVQEPKKENEVLPETKNEYKPLIELKKEEGNLELPEEDIEEIEEPNEEQQEEKQDAVNPSFKPKTKYVNSVPGYPFLTWCEKDGTIGIKRKTVSTKTDWPTIRRLSAVDVETLRIELIKMDENRGRRGVLRAFIQAVKENLIKIPETEAPKPNGYLTATKMPPGGWRVN